MPQQPIAGRYRLVRPLGQGGQGRVWLARDEVLRRDVAIKELVPPPGLSEEEQHDLRVRAMREARTVARLNQINVVRIFDVVTDGGKPWIVMEFVASRPLHVILRQDGPLRPEQAARIGLSVLAALRAAHRAGVLHRDVKPANVLLAEDGRVVLTDFGLAAADGDPGLTQSGVVLGSPAYLAPERVLDHPVGPASDLWSLGAALYAAVEGRSPYARSTPIATLAALTTELPPPPQNAGPLRPALEGLLRRDPQARIDIDEAELLLRQALGDEASGSAALPWTSASSFSGGLPASSSFGNAASTSAAPEAAPPLAGPAVVPGENAPKRSPARLLAGALVVVALLALGVGVVLVKPGLFGAGADAAGPRPVADASGSATAGWHYYRDNPAFSLPVPDGWPAVGDGRHVEFREPGGSRLLLVDELAAAPDDLVGEERDAERADAVTYPEYQRIALGKAGYAAGAADREWTYAGGGDVRMHAVSRTFVGETGRAYRIGWHTPDADWAADGPMLALVYDGFRAAPAGPAVASSAPRASRSAKPSPKPRKSATSSAPAVPPVAAKAIRNQATGMCIDVPNNRADATGPMQTWGCNGADGQKYQFPADGTLRVFGRCLQADGTADGSTLHLADCTGSGMQQFTLNAAADLVNRQLDKCVEVADADPASGALIRITTCAGPSQQKWYLA